MSITLTTNYQEIFCKETIDEVEQLLNDGYDLKEVLEFLDFFGEDRAEIIADLIEAVDDTECKLGDLEEFIDEYGDSAVDYFVDYWKLLDHYNPGAIEAFLKLFDVDCLTNFHEYYEGFYQTDKQFIDDFIQNKSKVTIPDWIIIDYETTWVERFSDFYSQENGHYFRNEF